MVILLRWYYNEQAGQECEHHQLFYYLKWQRWTVIRLAVVVSFTNNYFCLPSFPYSSNNSRLHFFALHLHCIIGGGPVCILGRSQSSRLGQLKQKPAIIMTGDIDGQARIRDRQQKQNSLLPECLLSFKRLAYFVSGIHIVSFTFISYQLLETKLEKVKIDSTNKIVHIFMPDPRIRSCWNYCFCSPRNGKQNSTVLV
jgi:hypothetical protein